jgi:hypothetical protein
LPIEEGAESVPSPGQNVEVFRPDRSRESPNLDLSKGQIDAVMENIDKGNKPKCIDDHF